MTDQETRPVVFWDCDLSAERLLHEDIGEAVYDWGDSTPLPLPEFVTVYGWVRMELPSAERLADDALARILEYLDEEFGDPEGDGSGPTGPMREAARQFAETVRAEYEGWMCEQVTSERVRVADYVPSEWLNAAPEAPAHAD